jgi:DNA invertase Pin-like site-specific DNA recombinase
MRAAIYARYSSDLQRETSLEDQIAVAKRYATERKWTVLKDHIYTDAGISGASIQNRPSVQRLLAAAAQQPKPFDVLLVDDSSRIARDIADAIRVMQTLKFLGVRVIYISQGIDSDSDQADALVAVHGLIDSLYLKELAKKVKRGLAGQMDRGFSTGARQYGYRKTLVPDPSGRKDAGGRLIPLGTRIEVNEEEAKVIRRIFEWVADGVGLTTILERLNAEGVPGTGGKRWSKGALTRVVKNERYLGRQIWGQQSVEHEPGTGRRIMRDNPRHEWKITERPELRIISDELWERAQKTRADVRAAVAPKRNLARGKDARYQSKHLLTGFAKCAICGYAMTSVSGGSGSPRLGCRRSWGEGRDACPNRLTIRMKIAEPQILARLQSELLKPAAADYIVKSVEKEFQKALAEPKSEKGTTQRQLDSERRKVQNLVAAIEGGSDAPGALLKAVAEREATIKRLEAQVKRESQKQSPVVKPPEMAPWVREQLQNLTALLKSDPAKAKSEFRRLNLQLTFNPVEAKPRANYVVKGQCDLSALVLLFLRRKSQSAVLDRMRAHQVHSRTPVLLGFR